MLALCVPARAFAAESSRPVEHLDQDWKVTSLADESGLRRRNVYDVAFQPDGTAWIAASDGLYRYDGYQWKTFSLESGLPSEIVRAVLWTQQGELWVGTAKGAGVFVADHFNPRGSDAIHGVSIKKMAQDPDGTIWMWSDRYPDPTSPGGIASYKDGVWRAYHEIDGLPNEKVRNYFRTSDGHQYVTTGTGLGERIPGADRWIAVPVPQAPNGAVPWALSESQGNVIATCAAGMYVKRGPTWELTSIKPPSIDGLVNMMLRARDGSVLVIGYDYVTGASLFEWTGTGFRRVSPSMGRRANWVHAVREAPDGAIWVVGERGFIVRWERHGGEWTGYDQLPIPQYTDESGRAVFGGSFDHVYFKPVEGQFRYAEGHFEPVAALEPPDQLDDGRQMWNLQDDKRTIVVSKLGAKVAVHTADEAGLHSVAQLLLDGHHVPWVAGVDSAGVLRLASYHDGRWFHAIGEDQLAGQTLLGVKPSPEDGVWLLLERKSEISVVRLSADKPERHPVAFERTSNGAIDFKPDSQHRVWVYGAGVSSQLFEVETGTDGTPGRPHPEIGATVSTVVTKPDETWFTLEAGRGGGDGLVTFARGKWRQFSLSQNGSAWATSDQTIYFGDNDRLHVLYPKGDGTPVQLSMLDAREPSPPSIRDREGNLWVTLTDTPRKDSRVFRYHPDGVPPETVIADSSPEVREDGRFRLHVHGIERFVPLHDQKSFRYSWRFDDQPWTSFRGLPADGLDVQGLKVGSHRFTIRAQDEGLDVDPSPAEAILHILAIPLEQRIWFKPMLAALFALLAILALAAIDRARKFRIANVALGKENEIRRVAEAALQQAHAELETLVEKRTQQLRSAHDELRAAYAEVEKRLKNEMEIAERIQTSLLPREPKVAGLDVACRMWPATEVGGDYYDVIPAKNGAWLGIGDVAGHGLPAGLIMLMFQSALAALIAADPEIKPVDALAALNRMLCENIRKRLGRDEHITACLLRYYDDGRVRIAGRHEDIVVYRAAQRACEIIRTPGAWLGISQRMSVHLTETEFRLNPGDLLVLYTDGVLEARNAQGRQFGIERLCEAIVSRGADSVSGYPEVLFEQIKAWAPVQEDDVSLVVARHRGLVA